MTVLSRTSAEPADAQPWADDGPGGDGARLCARFLCRISGAPVDGVESLRAPRALRLVQELHAAGRSLAERREAVSALLFRAVAAQGDPAPRNALLRVRRDLFNLRPVPPARLDAACALLAPDDAAAVRDLARALDAEAELRAQAARAFAGEAAGARARFRALLGDADLRKGLLISSRSLRGALDRYVAAGEDVAGRDEKTERGLLRYLTRMAMKSTPFSTFCAVVEGRFVAPDGGVDGFLRLHGDPRRKRSYVRINKLLYGILLEHLKKRPAVRRALPVEPNPTLRRDEDRLVFLAAVGGREVFQRLAPGEVLELIVAAFARGAVPLGELVGTLSGDPRVEATPEQAEAYLDRLLEIGFLRFHTGIREQDADWDLPFRALLGAIDDPHAHRAAELLARLRERTEAYATADADARAAIVGEIQALVDGAFGEMEITAWRRNAMAFYEDATADARAEVVLTPGTARTVDAFARWVRVTSRLAWPRGEQATMRHFFDAYYGPTPGVPLLRFYEDFYREHFKAHVEKERKRRTGGEPGAPDEGDPGNPFSLPFVAALAEARTRLAAHVRERWREDPAAAEVRLTLAEVERLLADVEPPRAPCRSVSAFVAAAPGAGAGGDPALVLQGGSYTAGFGKYFSRFLYMLPDGFREAVRAGNEALTGEYLAEICGDAQFNANLHPPLLPWEISYPTGESGDAGDQLPSGAIRVEPDPDDPHALCLRHGPDGRRVVPVDLGFLNPRMRPPLYQLLSRFTPPVAFAPTLPESLDAPAKGPRPPSDGERETEAVGADTVREAGESGSDASADDASPIAAEADGDAAAGPDAGPPKITHRPRITVEGRLVLARRRWTVPGAAFPQRRAGESASDFFVRANLWRMREGLPESAYLRVIPLPDPSRPAPPAAAEPPAPSGDEAATEAAAVPEAHPEPDPVDPGASTPDGSAGEAETAAAGGPKNATAGSRDLYKPQFMDFASPLLVGLLGRMGANLARFTVVVEERLPDADGLPRRGDERYASELVLQLDFPEAAEAAPAATRREEAAHGGV